MTDESTRVIVVGDAASREMQPVASVIDRLPKETAVLRVDDIDSAIQLVAEKSWYPDLLVVCQHWPDEFPKSAVERLLSLLPLTRWVCCFGAWCESDGRNREIWPTAVRIPARCAAPRLRHELAVLRNETPPLPLTASRDETFTYDCPGDVVATGNGRPVLVKTPDPELRRWLNDLLTEAGFRIVASINDGPPAAVVWDIDPCSEETAADLRGFHRQHPETAVICWMGLPHPEDVEMLKSSGAAHVVTKLSTHTTLLESLIEATRVTSRAPSGAG